MLSALRPSSRRAWRLSRPVQEALEDIKVPKSHAVLSVRSFSSSVVEGEGPLSGNSASGKEEAVERHWRSMTWEKKILGALRAYKDINGDLLVTRSCVIPTGDVRWPREAWGYRLGDGVGHLRARAAKQDLPPELADQLKEVGFVFNVYPFQWDEIIMPALRHYFKAYGDTDVTFGFVVPSGDNAWPRLTWDWKLGNTVDSVRNNNAYSQQVRESEKELKELKFCYEMSIAERNWNERVLPALKLYSQENYHCLVERSFKVPHESPWPEETWRLPLGRVVSDIRMGKTYAEQTTRDKDILIQLGFSWDYHTSHWKERVLPALEVCAVEFGHFRLPQKWVVPWQDPWLRNMWGVKLGNLLHHMRYSGTHFAYIGRDAKRLEALGFQFELSHLAWEKKVVPLLETYAKVYGDKTVPPDFVIPSESPWPETMWGVHLGIFVDRNRTYLSN